ncbi:hypothetical protein DYQ86_00995 [Acidobacteria bacterium AB60]|nr:hypothetical protein DYQ86_00995 [Acidobacteria bacterium AB60]
MRFRNGLTFLLLAIAAPLASMATERPSSWSDCSYLVVNQTYGNQFNGFLNVPAYFRPFGITPPPGLGVVPNGGLGTMKFLPDGKMTNTETLSIGMIGLQRDLPIKGTYSVAWDTDRSPIVCSGTVQGFDPSGTQYNFAMEVSNDGGTVNLIHTDPGLIVSVLMSRMHTGRCSNDTINANYAVNGQGWVLGAILGAQPAEELGGYVPGSAVGSIRFHPYASPSGFSDAPAGAGTFDWWDTLALNGMIIPRVATGWYKINPDCTGMMTKRDNTGAPDSHLELLVGKDGGMVYNVTLDTVTIPNGMTIPAHVLAMTFDRMNDSRR